MRRYAITAVVIMSGSLGLRCFTYGAAVGPDDADAATGNDAAVERDASVAPDAPSFFELDADTLLDGGVDGEPDACISACDCDGDGFKSSACQVTMTDCDEHDPLIHPGKSFEPSPWPKLSPHTPAGDWDCDGVVVRQYKVDATCGASDASCANRSGFMGNPSCGEMGPFVNCALISIGTGTMCIATVSTNKVQGCR